MRFRCAALWALALTAQAWGQPAAPTGLDASDGVYTVKVGLAWEHVRGAVLYEVLRSPTSDPAQAITVGTTASIIYYDTTAVAGQTYTYWVRAHGDGGASGLSTPDEGTRAVGRETGFDSERLAPLEPPPVPPGNPQTGAKIYLGKTLFWEEQLSSTRTMSCGTCHRFQFGGSDPRSFATPAFAAHPGHDGVFGTEDDVVGSPGVVLNYPDGTYGWSALFGMHPQVTRRKAQSAVDAAYGPILFWDGRASEDLRDPLTGEVVLASGAALENQALHPLVDATEMSAVGRDWPNIFARLAASRPLALSPNVPPALAAWIGDRGYPELFEEAFDDAEISAPRIAMAIGAYERTLYSDHSLFDQISSNIRQHTAAAARGRKVFIDQDCNRCHQTSLFTDHRFKNIGLRPPEEDEGRFEVTQVVNELAEFRTPSLLNSVNRGPFMHNGRETTLADVVDFYDRGGDFSGANIESLIRPLHLTEQEKSDLVVFMATELVDPRVSASAAPLFDRPMLYTESARVPASVGEGRPGFGGKTPQMVALEPPFLGNPSFTVGLYDARPGAQAILMIDDDLPPLGLVLPTAASFLSQTTTVADGGYASISVAIPNDPLMAGDDLYGRWYVIDSSADRGFAASAAFRIQLFAVDAGLALDTATSVSSASFAAGLMAPESLASAFGDDLAAFEEYAVLPLPTVLGGASLVVRDSTGAERLARLIYASPKQINYEVPSGTAPGEATLRVVRGGVSVAAGTIQVANTGPSLFSANSSGSGTAAAVAIHVAPGGEQTWEMVAAFDSAEGKFTSKPIDLGLPGDEVYLSLFGTGIRFGQDLELTVGGLPVEIVFSGPQETYAGLDQVNALLPRSLAGRGEVDVRLKVDGILSNVVRVSFE